MSEFGGPKWRPKTKDSEAREYVGTIKHFSDDKGFGFITCEELTERYQTDVFLHASQLCGFVAGDNVQFGLTFNSRGSPQAVDLKEPAKITIAGNENQIGSQKAKVPAAEEWHEEQWLDSTQSDASWQESKWKPKRSADNREYEGTIKQFNKEKGFGFILCRALSDQYQSDVFVHASQIGNFNAGDAVMFTVNFNSRGSPQAIDLRDPASIMTGAYGDPDFAESVPWNDTNMAIGQYPPWNSGRNYDDQQEYEGTIKQFNKEKGFGFITCQEVHDLYQSDVFVHQTQINGFKPGETARFTVTFNSRGSPQAIDLRPASSQAGKQGKEKRMVPEVAPGSFREPREARPEGAASAAAAAGAAAAPDLGVAEKANVDAESWKESRWQPKKKDSEVRGYEGTIKHFKQDKGFGFIECKELYERHQSDVFLHGSQIGSFNVGDAVCFSVSFNSRGSPQAIELTAPVRKPIGSGEEAQPAGNPSREDEQLNAPTDQGTSDDRWRPKRSDGDSREYEGFINSFSVEKGFGHISCLELTKRYQSDVVVHSEQVGSFVVGDRIRFGLQFNSRGAPEGVDLRKLEPLAVEEKEQAIYNDEGYGDDDDDDEFRDRAASEPRYEGIIKHFSEAKGYGFITCNETHAIYTSDVFIHAKQLAGFICGEAVSFIVKINARGQPQALDLQPPIRSEGLPDPDAPGIMAGSAKGKRDIYQGVVKTFSEDKGYGFIRCTKMHSELKNDVFVHNKHLNGFVQGDRVQFNLRIDAKGRMQATGLCKSVSLGEADEDDLADVLSSVPDSGADGGGAYAGVVKYIDKEKGYGFIRCQETHALYGSDVFAHQKHVAGRNIGDHVRFWLKGNARGKPQARTVQVCDPPDSDDGEIADDDETNTKVGTIKSFDDEHGYGFIACADSFEKFGRDVFLHNKQVRHFKPGERVSFLVRINAAGHPQAYKLREAPKSLAWLAGEPEEAGDDGLDRYNGEIKSFNSLKAYGFIECTALYERFGRDVFIPSSQFEGLGVGDIVEFRIQIKRGQPQAHDVVRLEDENGPRRAAPKPPSEYEGMLPEQLAKKLLRACASARIESVGDMERILQAGGDANARDVSGQSALMVSALNVRQAEPKCRLLVEHGADVHGAAREDEERASDDVAQTVLEWARERVGKRFAAYLDGWSRGEYPDCAFILDTRGDGDAEF